MKEELKRTHLPNFFHRCRFRVWTRIRQGSHVLFAECRVRHRYGGAKQRVQVS